MDETDFDHFDDDPQPGKLRKEKPTWAIILLEQIRNYVLREPDDFILKQELARRLNYSEPAVGSCIAALIREGILTPLQPVPPHEHLRVGEESCYWENGQWMVSGTPGHRERLRAIRGIRRKAKWKVVAGTKPTVAKWDGRANFIIRGDAFKKACKGLNFPEDPHADWTCPKCGNQRPWDALECSNYITVPFCNYKRPSQSHWPVPVKLRVCERCGAEISQSTTHKLRHCNAIIVRDIMNS